MIQSNIVEIVCIENLSLNASIDQSMYLHVKVIFKPALFLKVLIRYADVDCHTKFVYCVSRKQIKFVKVLIEDGIKRSKLIATFYLRSCMQKHKQSKRKIKIVNIVQVLAHNLLANNKKENRKTCCFQWSHNLYNLMSIQDNYVTWFVRHWNSLHKNVRLWNQTTWQIPFFFFFFCLSI